MKIYSWNIFFKNGKLGRAFEFIKTLDFDVLCLQEVPEEFLARLRELPYHVVSQTEVDRFLPGGKERTLLVILSKHDIVRHGVFPLEVPHTPLRTRLFVRAMRPLNWSHIENRQGLYADIMVEGFPTPVDHILVSRTLSVVHAGVLRERTGSDHHPISVEVR